MARKTAKKFAPLGALILMVAILAPILYIQNAKASNFTFATIRLDRMQANTFTSMMVCAKPTSSNTETSAQIIFPSGFTLSTTPGDWTTNSTTNSSWPTGASGWPAISGEVTSTTTNTNDTATFTFTSTAMSTSTTYCFNMTSTTAALKTPVATGTNLVTTMNIRTVTPTVVDSSQVGLTVVAAGYDQVAVTGTVAPTFSFALSGTSAPLGTIANSVVSASPTPTVTIVTNASRGWTTWVSDANNGTLTSAGASANIPTPGAVGSNYDLSTMAATGAYGLGVTVSGGVTVTPEYAGAVASHAGTLSSTFRPIASSSTYATSDVVTLIPRAIAKTTQAPAADYTDTLTVVAAGQF